jgi:hypothetical protein
MNDLGVARRRIRNSRLAGASFDAPDEAVRWHGAMQAQDYSLAKWSIGQRVPGLADGDVDRALEAGTLVRTHVLRPTWHFVAPDDVRWMLALTGPRVLQHVGPRQRQLELDHRTLTRCEVLIASALQGGNHLTRDAIGGVLAGAGIDASGQRLPHILLHCELQGVICSGGLAGKRHAYALLDERVSKDRPLNGEEALVELARRYLQSHGPATVQDLRWWSSLTIANIKKALHLLGSEVQSEMIDGITFWSVATSESSSRRGRRGHLLQAFDELLVGYTESRYFGDPRAAAARAAWTNPSLPNGVVLVNHGVAGHWKRTVDKGSISVRVVVYEDLTSAGGRAVEAAAARFGRFLGRQARLEVRSLAKRPGPG